MTAEHHPTELAPVEARIAAIESVLVEKGVLDTDALDAIVQHFEDNLGPMNGARVVARAWTDPQYKARLLADGTAAIAELGFGGQEAEHVVALDVAYGELDFRLREDPRVTVIERVNARSLDPAVLPWGVVRPFVEDYALPSPAQLARRTAGCTRMWLISSHEGQPNGPAQSRAHRARWFALAAELERRFGHGRVYKFSYASVIHVQLMPGRRP